MKFVHFTVIFFSVLVLITTSCKNEEKRHKAKNQIEEKKLNKERTDSLEAQSIMNIVKPAKEDLTLIALKYRINDSVAEKIIWEYSKTHNEIAILFSALYSLKSDSIVSDSILLEKLKGSELKETKIMTIYRLSNKYNISTDTLASIIFDYEIWMAIKQTNDTDY